MVAAQASLGAESRLTDFVVFHAVDTMRLSRARIGIRREDAGHVREARKEGGVETSAHNGTVKLEGYLYVGGAGCEQTCWC